MNIGELVLVGSGIELGRHVSQRVISEITSAEAVFSMTDPWAHEWLLGLRPDTVALQDFYGRDKDRRETYREMDAAIMAAVRAGKRVCAVFYGHPGVFADVPHETLRKARSEGHRARMEPGISAEACLYADLGMDPGRNGVQSLEATHFLVHEHVINPSALLILWQVALAGDLSCTHFHAEPDRLRVLVEKLRQWYPPDTEVILYEAAQIAVDCFRADRMALADLPTADYREHTTLVIPPTREPVPDRRFLDTLNGLLSPSR